MNIHFCKDFNNLLKKDSPDFHLYFRRISDLYVCIYIGEHCLHIIAIVVTDSGPRTSPEISGFGTFGISDLVPSPESSGRHAKILGPGTLKILFTYLQNLILVKLPTIEFH